MDKTVEILQNVFLFKGIENVLEGAELPAPVCFKKGELIYSETEFRRALGILISGKAKATPAGNSETGLNTFLPGAVFGAAGAKTDAHPGNRDQRDPVRGRDGFTHNGVMIHHFVNLADHGIHHFTQTMLVFHIIHLSLYSSARGACLPQEPQFAYFQNLPASIGCTRLTRVYV